MVQSGTPVVDFPSWIGVYCRGSEAALCLSLFINPTAIIESLCRLPHIIALTYIRVALKALVTFGNYCVKKKKYSVKTLAQLVIEVAREYNERKKTPLLQCVCFQKPK